jgi:RNA polymerase sigma-70 factor (ECF subfamily)
MTLEALHSRVLDSDIRYLIRTKARQLSRANGFQDHDRDDLEQELTLRLLQRLKAYDPAKASFYCFAIVVLDRVGKHILESRRAASRDTSTTLSLQMPRPPHPRKEDDPTPLDQLIVPSDRANRVGRYTLPEDQLCELVLDVKSVVDTLPDDLRELARDLAVARRSEILRRTGESASHLRERCLRLRAALERAGLGNGESAARD